MRQTCCCGFQPATAVVAKPYLYLVGDGFSSRVGAQQCSVDNGGLMGDFSEEEGWENELMLLR